MWDRRAENVSGLISRSSRSLYRLSLNVSSSFIVITSVASPGSPTCRRFSGAKVDGCEMRQKTKSGVDFAHRPLWPFVPCPYAKSIVQDFLHRCVRKGPKQKRAHTAQHRHHPLLLSLPSLPSRSLTMSLSPILKIFSKSVATVWAWLPSRLSEQMPTQFLPVMARMAAPLYSKID